MVLLRAGCAAALLMLVSCWTPVFNQDLSVAELVRGKLKLEMDHTTTLNNGGNQGNVYQAGMSFDGTAWAVLSSNHNQVNLMATNLLGADFTPTSLDVPLTDPSQVMIQPDSSGVNWYIPTAIHYPFGAGDVHDITASGVYSGYWQTSDSVIGFATYEDNNFHISAYYLTESVTTPHTVTLNLIFDLGASNPVVGPVNYSGTGGWMAVNPAGSSGTVVYLTHAPDASGEYVTDMIDGTGLVATWKGHDHVAGFLSTGRLLTREGSFYNVCDSKGKILYSFPAGTLQFAGEYADPSSTGMRVRFTEAILESAQNGGQDKVRLRVYSVATAKLDTLQ